MTRRIEFINPFGTPAYDAIISETLAAYAGEGTEITVSSLEGCPPNIDYYYNKHLMETVVFEKVMRAEAAGFDAVVVGCCYDPASGWRASWWKYRSSGRWRPRCRWPAISATATRS